MQRRSRDRETPEQILSTAIAIHDGHDPKKTDGALSSQSRLGADTFESHTHVQQVARCAHAHITGCADGYGQGALAKIDRKLLAGLCDDEALRTLRVPATAAKWATWKRYCDTASVSTGRVVATLMDLEMLSVFGDHTAGKRPVFAQAVTEELGNRESRIEAREHKVDIDEARIREESERLRRWEDELEARGLRAVVVSKLTSRQSAARTKIGRNERCPCGSGLKYKHCQ